MIEFGYEGSLEEKVNEILRESTIKTIVTTQNADYGVTTIETEGKSIEIRSQGGHGGVGLNFYVITDKE